MINYNSCIDSYALRYQISPISYSVIKKPMKMKPKLRFFHEKFLQSKRPGMFVPPVISSKKPLSLSPRRVTNIDFKIPSPESFFKKNPSISPMLDSHELNISSLSSEFPKAPIVYSKLKHKLPSISQTTYDPSLTPVTSEVSLSMPISKKNKNLPSISYISSGTLNLYSNLVSFHRLIEKRYTKMYEEIDTAQKGYITLDDFINLVMFINLVNSQSSESFDTVKSRAESILTLFEGISSSNKITKKDFFAVCSLYEHIRTSSDQLNLLDTKTCMTIKTKLEEVNEIFKCYSINGRIKTKDLHNMLVCLRLSNLKSIEELLCFEVIDLSCFIRFLPLFSWMHENVIKSLNLTN
jgi:Ca2+-binding EF-hand superfamily protein